MRVSDNRYVRELRQVDLARRLIHYRTRTHWISAITGLTPNAVRNLVTTYEGAEAARRRSGKEPRRWQLFFEYSRRREAGALAGLAVLFALLPERPVRPARQVLPGLEWGERLCKAFDILRIVVPKPTSSMDEFLLLVTLLAEGHLNVGFCVHCQATIVVDPLATGTPLCDGCLGQRHSPLDASSPDGRAMPESTRCPSEIQSGEQQTLF